MAQPDTETVAFRMTLNPGAEAEYRRRHDEIWPELVEAIREAGVIDYRIFLDAPTHGLLAVMTRRRDHGLDALGQTPVMKRWWAMMADVMETHLDTSPVSEPLREMFQLSIPPTHQP